MTTHPARVKKAAVLGAGVMGAQIAAHLINANIETLLFELPADEKDTNANVIRAIDKLKKQEPAPLSTASRVICIEPANYDQHLERLGDCDLIIEAIAERLELKAQLYEKITPYLHDNVILASNTSGLSIGQLANAVPQSLRTRFCGVHFFNPPRYMHLVELIASDYSDAAMLDTLETFLVTTLGKGVVRAKDTPNFIANRIGIFSMLATMHHARQFGLGFELVDKLTGSLIGRPKSATFRTADLVGLDILMHVIQTMQDNLVDDPWHNFYTTPDWLDKLVKDGSLGQKTGKGVYQKQGKEIYVLDPEHEMYRLAEEEVDDEVEAVLKLKDAAARFAALRIHRHSSCGPFIAICSTIVQFSLNLSQTVHVTSIWRCAGDLAGSRGRLKSGNQPGGMPFWTG